MKRILIVLSLAVMAAGATNKGLIPSFGPDRQIPDHDTVIFAGCSDENIKTIYASIAGAIEIGAPLYNEGYHEACYRIYEGTALRLERDLPKKCRGPARALAAGVKRSDGLSSQTDKAWAMRDTFDGMLNAAEKLFTKRQNTY